MDLRKGGKLPCRLFSKGGEENCPCKKGRGPPKNRKGGGGKKNDSSFHWLGERGRETKESFSHYICCPENRRKIRGKCCTFFPRRIEGKGRSALFPPFFPGFCEEGRGEEKGGSIYTPHPL